MAKIIDREDIELTDEEIEAIRNVDINELWNYIKKYPTEGRVYLAYALFNDMGIIKVDGQQDLKLTGDYYHFDSPVSKLIEDIKLKLESFRTEAVKRCAPAITQLDEIITKMYKFYPSIVSYRLGIGKHDFSKRDYRAYSDSSWNIIEDALSKEEFVENIVSSKLNITPDLIIYGLFLKHAKEAEQAVKNMDEKAIQQVAEKISVLYDVLDLFHAKKSKKDYIIDFSNKRDSVLQPVIKFHPGVGDLVKFKAIIEQLEQEFDECYKADIEKVTQEHLEAKKAKKAEVKNAKQTAKKEKQDLKETKKSEKLAEKEDTKKRKKRLEEKFDL